MMEIKRNKVIFSSGRQMYANCGIVGISLQPDGSFTLTEGYDSGFGDMPLSPIERIELGNYMLGLWQDFRQNALEEDNIKQPSEQIDILVSQVQALKSDVGYLLHLAGNNLRESIND